MSHRLPRGVVDVHIVDSGVCGKAASEEPSFCRFCVVFMRITPLSKAGPLFPSQDSFRGIQCSLTVSTNM